MASPDRTLGDMPKEEFRQYGYRIVDWIADYMENLENFPVLSQIEPGSLIKQLPETAPDAGENFGDILEDLDAKILPAITHWNHPNFHGLFATSSPSVAIFGELLTAAFDQKALLWRTSPASTELDEVALGWLQKLAGLPDSFRGIIYDTASVSTLHGIAMAREKTGRDIRMRGMSGRSDLPLMRLYCSDQTHSSIEKSLLTLGLGKAAVQKIDSGPDFCIDIVKLAEAIVEDKKNGHLPFCVVATIGTTSTASCDDLKKIAEICRQHELWLHVDMAYAGCAMILPELRRLMDGIELADSIVVNPHKWLFTTFDLSVLYVKDLNLLKSAFSIVPEYLKVDDKDVTNQMDLGIQLGRRFRSLKMWFVMRYFGTDGLRARIREHIRLAKLFASWVDSSDRLSLKSPVNFALVCFRAEKNCGCPEEDLDAVNATLMEQVNRSGEAYLSHTKLNGEFVIRLCVGSIRVEERHITKVWNLINSSLDVVLTRKVNSSSG